MKDDDLNVCHLNINHLYNKIPDVTRMIFSQDKTIHILGITESMFDDRKDDRNLEINNYTIIRRDGLLDLHRGITVYIHNSIIHTSKRRQDLETREIESV